ncbi:MAG: hypothetical protein P1P84_23610 [Deferrisomatales bacterium]|nr:hypothetical protein [Deferrisomatales bacterium]
MPRFIFPSFILACSLCAAVPAVGSPAPFPGLMLETQPGPGWGSGLRLGLLPGEVDPRQWQAPGGWAHPRETELAPPLWESPLRLSWSGSVPVRCSAALAASYAVPDTADALSPGEVLDGGRFRAWVRSGVQWRYTEDAVLTLDARCSPADLHGFDSAPPFQAAATVTVPW